MQTLDGFGTLRAAAADRRADHGGRDADNAPSLDHPPGYYGTAGSPRAINVLGPKSVLAPLPALPAGAERLTYESRERCR